MNTNKIHILTKIDKGNLPIGIVIACSDEDTYFSKIWFDYEYKSILASSCESYFVPTYYLKEIDISET